jgi:hypothetical protein
VVVPVEQCPSHPFDDCPDDAVVPGLRMPGETAQEAVKRLKRVYGTTRSESTCTPLLFVVRLAGVLEGQPHAVVQAVCAALHHLPAGGMCPHTAAFVTFAWHQSRPDQDLDLDPEVQRCLASRVARFLTPACARTLFESFF